MKKKLILATRNAGKLRECQYLLRDTPYQVIGLEDAGFEEDIEETGTTLEENATIKARHIYQKTQCAVLAEDSGLFVEVLDGSPGVFSARYAGIHGNDGANWQLLLKNMEGMSNRKASFKACLCYIDDHGTEHFFNGILNGQIAHEANGSHGFGYDPIFIPDGYDVTNAQLDPAVKNSISHRAKAIAGWLDFLQS